MVLRFQFIKDSWVFIRNVSDIEREKGDRAAVGSQEDDLEMM